MRCRASLVLLRSIGMAKKKLAVPKATSASKSAGGAIVSSPAASSGSQPAAGVAAAPSAEESGKRRRLFKRDSEERVQRIIDRKFANIDAVIIDSRRNKAGQSLRDVIAQALRDLTPRRKYLSFAFWTKLFDDFDLHSAFVEQLPPVGDHIPIADDLLEALMVATAENPATRSSEPLEAFLEFCTAVNEAELVLILKSTVEGPVISRRQSRKMQLFLMKHIGRASVHTKFPHIWNVIREPFDGVLNAAYKEHQAKCDSSRLNFIRAHSEALHSFVSPDQLSSMVDVIQNRANVDQRILREVAQTAIGASLFLPESLQLNYANFITNCTEQLNSIEHNDFEYSEYLSFRQVMLAETNALIKQGHKPYAKKATSLEFLGREMEVSVSSIHDEWDLRFKARIKSIAVSTGDLPRLPWERISFGDSGHLAGLPTVVRIPPKLLESARNAREAAIKATDGSGASFSEMRQLINHKDTLDTLMSIDRSFILEFNFLVHSAEPLCVESIRHSISQALPTLEVGKEIDESIQTIRKVKLSPMVTACGFTLHKELEGVLLFLQNLVDYVPPPSSKLAGVSPFFKCVLSAAENFLRLEVQKAPNNELASGDKVILVGKRAIYYLFSQFTRLKEEESPSEYLQQFKRFAWLLTPAQAAQVDKARDIFIIKQRSSLGLHKAILPPGEGAPASAASAGAASSSATVAIVLASPVPLNKAHPAPGSVEEKAAVAKHALKAQLLALVRKPR